MSDLQLAREARNAAKAAFDARLAKVRGDGTEGSGLGGQIKGKAQADAQYLLDQTLDVARESKGIIAAVIGALTLWCMRNPLFALANRLLPHTPDTAVEDEEIGEES